MTNTFKLNAVAILLFGSVSIAIAAPPAVPNNSGLPTGLLMRETQKAPEMPQKNSEAVIEDSTKQQRPPHAGR
jgi:hypothetical protein